jgi:hypothetical protein
MTGRDPKHFLRRRHFEIERPRQFVLEARYIGIRDVAAIFAKVRGDAIGSPFNREVRGAQRVGMHAAARIAQRRNVIDVDAKT